MVAMVSLNSTFRKQIQVAMRVLINLFTNTNK